MMEQPCEIGSESPLVSVIIPTYNRADLISRAVRSVLEQTYINLECIIVDDASTDNTSSVVKAFDDDRIRYLRHKTNRQTSAARNTGIAHAQGELIAFLDDDDEWLHTKLEKQVPLLENAPPQVGMVYCWMDYYDRGRLATEHHPTYRGYVFPHVLDGQRIGGCPTLLVRRSVFEDVGGFDESLVRGNDGDFIRRVCLNYDVDLIPEVLVKVYIGHSYKRITRHDEQGLWNDINSHRVKLVKFEKELQKYPKQTSNIYARIAVLYFQQGKWQKGLNFFGKAISVYPFSVQAYKSLAKGGVYLVRGEHR